MLKVLTVAWREFKQTVVRPAFLIGVIGIPILIVGIGAVAGLIMVSHKEPPLIGEVRIVAPESAVVTAAQLEFDKARIAADERREQTQRAEQALKGERGFMGGPQSDAFGQRGDVNISIKAADPAESIDSLKDRVRRGELLAVVEISQAILTPPPATEAATTEPSDDPAAQSFQLFVGENVDSDNVRLIERRLAKAVVRTRAEQAGLDGDQALQLVREPRAETTRARLGGGERTGNQGLQEIRSQILPMVFMMLIWIGTFSAGQPLMMSTIEEKSNRVMEVLLSAISPIELMTGKIIGYGAVGLLIVGIYSSVGIAALVAFAIFTDVIHWSHLVYLGVYFIMAYGMISCMMAMVGSAVSDVREANTLITPMMLILMVPLMLWMPISHDPNGLIATICSFVPPAIPFAMILRIASEEGVVWWQIALSMVWGFACVLAMIWMTAKIFRIGVLMYGKPPTPIELLRWIRYR